MAKPDLLKWITNDDPARVIDPGATKKLNGWIYRESPANQFLNWLFNRISKWLVGLQGDYYDIVVGSAAQVAAFEATHVITDLNDTLVIAGTKLLFLNGTHTLTANINLTNSSIALMCEQQAILDLSTFTLTLSGTYTNSRVRVINAGVSDIVVSGANSKISVYGADLTALSLSNGATGFAFSGSGGGIDAEIINATSVAAALVSATDTNSTNVTANRVQSAIILSLPPLSGGTTTAFTGSLGITAYEVNRVYELRMHAVNAAACTLDIDSIGALNVTLLSGANVRAGQIITNMIAKFLFNGSSFVLLNPASISRGCLVYKTAAQTITHAANTDVTFDSEEYDTDDMHDNATNNHRITVPSDASEVELWAQIVWAGTSGAGIVRNAFFIKNTGSSLFVGNAMHNVINANSGQNRTIGPLSSAPLRVVPGDYFAVQVYQDSAVNQDINPTSITGAVTTAFGMKILN